MADDSSPLVTGALLFVLAVVILAFVAPQLIPLASNLFAYWIVDHVEGMIVGAIVGAFLGSLGQSDVKIFGFTTSIGAIAGIILQYLLFH